MTHQGTRLSCPHAHPRNHHPQRRRRATDGIRRGGACWPASCAPQLSGRLECVTTNPGGIDLWTGEVRPWTVAMYDGAGKIGQRDFGARKPHGPPGRSGAGQLRCRKPPDTDCHHHRRAKAPEARARLPTLRGLRSSQVRSDTDELADKPPSRMPAQHPVPSGYGRSGHVELCAGVLAGVDGAAVHHGTVPQNLNC